MVLLNGTRITSTLAHHTTVVINSTTKQKVRYSLTFSVKYYEGLAVKPLMSKNMTDKMFVIANGTFILLVTSSKVKTLKTFK